MAEAGPVGADTRPVSRVRFDGVAAGGDAIGRMDDGRVIFCDGALPGEVATVEIVARSKDFFRARVIEVHEPSPARVAPPCPHVARGCGGCPWQHVDPTAAAEMKVDIVVDAVRRIARRRDPPVSRGAAVPLAAYRTTLRMAVDGEGRPAYRRRHSHDLVSVDSCLVTHPLVEELVVAARFPGAREVMLRAGASTGERLASPDRAHRRAAVPDGTRISTRERPVAVHEQVAGHSWRISAPSFFQSGPAAASLLVSSVTHAAGDHGPVVVDLYAGVGILGGVVASRGRLVAVESNPAAAEDAKVNLAHLDARVVTGDVARFTGSADLVIADPSRPGLGRPGAAAIAGLGPATVVLASCDPASFARDLVLLAGHGYRLATAEVLDLFPGTFHLEVVSRFVRDRPG